jgi:RNA polymerase sigma factor (sigma-70 family)
MAASGMQHALDWARSTILEREAAALSDAQLLEAFLAARSEAAIRAIIRRHGPMILGVCKRFLPEHHDAEDAFQAIFLVFIRRADCIRPHSQLANWLYGVALKTARKTRTYLGKKRFRERSMGQVPDVRTAPGPEWTDFWSLLDRELERLPSIYRAPIVLCDLEGKSRREAAQLLGIVDGTLSGRLTRGRRQLAARLSRRGVTLSGAALAAALVSEGEAASLPPGLISSTIQLALDVTLKGASATTAGVVPVISGGIRAMLFAKSWQASTILVVSLLAIGTSVGGLSPRNRAANVADPSGESETPVQEKGTSTQSGTHPDSALQATRKAERAKEIEAWRCTRDARKLEWEQRWKEYQAGRGTIDFLLQASAGLTFSELQIAETANERVAACQAQVDRLSEVYTTIEAWNKAGKTVTQDLVMGKAAYETAKTELLNEKLIARTSPSSEKLGTIDMAALRAQLLETGNGEWDSRWKEYSAGRGTLDFLLDSSRRFLAAELKCAKKSTDQVKAFQANIDRLASVEAINLRRFNAGKVALQDLLQARYARIEAELELAQLKGPAGF